MEILYNGHHCHWQCSVYSLYTHRKYTNSVTKVKGKNAILGSLHLLNLFSESPLSFQFQYLRYCSIIEHCTVNKVCIEFPKKSRTEHWECWGNYGSIEVYDCSTQLCGYFVWEADRTDRAVNEPLRSFNSAWRRPLIGPTSAFTLMNL